MSQNPSNNPRQEAAAQTDDALLSKYVPAGEKGAVRGSGLPGAISVLFSFLLCFAGIYLDRYAGDFSAKVYNENSRAYAASAVPAAPKAFDMVAYGKKQFMSACVNCHQATGLGVPGVYPPLAGSEIAQGDEQHLIRIVLFGLTGPVTVKGVTFPGVVQMPAFGEVPGGGYKWTDKQIAAVLTFVRQEWGNKAPAVAEATVTQIRKSVNRDKPWTIPELMKVK